MIVGLLWEAKATQRLSGKSIFPLYPKFWEHFSNRLLTSQFQETASGSCFTVVLVEVYACQESQVCECFLCTFVCIYCLNAWLFFNDHRRQRRYCTQLPACVQTPYISPLPASHPVMVIECGGGKSLIKAVALSETFFPEDPLSANIVGTTTSQLPLPLASQWRPYYNRREREREDQHSSAQKRHIFLKQTVV